MKQTLRMLSLLCVLCCIVDVAGSGASTSASIGLRETRLASSIQATLSPEIQISNSDYAYQPAVAYNDDHDEYLVVWYNSRPGVGEDIYARRVSARGELLSWFAVATGNKDELYPAVAYNSTEQEYLVVWMLYEHPSYEIWGRIVGWNGSYMGPEFRIITWPLRDMRNPRVAWNSVQNEYLVVWHASDTATGLATDLSSMLLGPDGVLITGRNLTTSHYPTAPDLVYNPVTDEYLVVFVGVDTQATTGNDIYGLRVAADNYVIDPPGAIMISAEPSSQDRPAVATNGRFSYAVVWMSLVGADWDIHARKLDFNGNMPWGNRVAIASSTDHEIGPAIASNGNEYLIAWQRDLSRIVGRYWDIQPAQFLEVAPGAPNYCGAADAAYPAIAAGRTNFLFTYEGDSSQIWPECLPRVFGRLWSPYGVFLPLVLTSP